jgi:nucleoid-associated protein YgaU
MRKIISLICFLLPVLAFAATPDAPADIALNVRGDAPERYIVVKGDTLWDISGKFFKDPWKWPKIWGVNKDTIKDPHWIYPGDVIIFDPVTGTLRIADSNDVTTSYTSSNGVTKISPKAYMGSSDHDAIPSIPASVIGPFLSQPLVIENEDLQNAPMIVGAREGRVILATDDVGFAKGLTEDKGVKWQMYRPGKTFVDPDTKEQLGVEAIYLGNAEATKFAEVSTINITKAVQEVRAGDRLAVASNETASFYLPRSPETAINAKVISVYGGVSQAGSNTVITLNKGERDGLAVGHVLALNHKGEVITHEDKKYTLPDERYGLAFVFRVFNKVSYALVMQTYLPVQLLDSAKTP